MLSEIAKQQLSKSGWYEGRCIDLTMYEERCKELGLFFFPAAKGFCPSSETLTSMTDTLLHIKIIRDQYTRKYIPIIHRCQSIIAKIIKNSRLKYTKKYYV